MFSNMPFCFIFEPMKINKPICSSPTILSFIWILLLSIVLGTSCNNGPSEGIYGEKFEVDNPITADAFLVEMSQKDTLAIQVSGKIQSVCKHEGCWILIESTEGEKIYINTKDKAFKLPPTVIGKTAIANGMGQSVKKQIELELAKGADPNDLTWIKAPSIEATGILIKP